MSGQPCSEAARLDRFWLEFSALIPGWEERRAMKASRFSDAHKAFILKQGADGMPVADLCAHIVAIANAPRLPPYQHGFVDR